MIGIEDFSKEGFKFKIVWPEDNSEGEYVVHERHGEYAYVRRTTRPKDGGLWGDVQVVHFMDIIEHCFPVEEITDDEVEDKKVILDTKHIDDVENLLRENPSIHSASKVVLDMIDVIRDRDRTINALQKQLRSYTKQFYV